MQQFNEQVYLSELLQQCCYAELSHRDLQRAIAARNLFAVFHATHGMLTHLSAISRLLWPPKSSGAQSLARGDYLRKTIEIADAHPLHDRTLRNHLEHFDERLDEFLVARGTGNMIDNIVGSPRAIGGSSFKDSDVLRAYDPSTGEMWFRGERFELGELYASMDTVKKRASERLKR